MRVAITGGTGFLGRYLIGQLLDQGHQITAWFRSSRPDALNSDTLNSPQIDWVPGQLGNAEDAERLVRSADAVVHAGLARSGASFLDSGDDPLDYWNRNATGSLQLLDAASRCGAKKFIFVSSGAVHDHVLADRPLDETHPLLPQTLYGACKASVETLVHHYGTSGQICSATVRPTAIYGVCDKIENSKWFDLVRRVCAGQDVHATGGSKAVHADDVAKAAILLINHDHSIAGETFNCCDRMISDFEVATLAQRISGSTSNISGQAKIAKHEIRTDKIQALGMRFGGDQRLQQTVEQLVAAMR